MELMPGVLAADLLRSRDQERPYVETWSGLLLGVLDAAIDNYDRTAANWIIAYDGTIAGIDHAASFTEPGRPGRVSGTTEPGGGAIRSAFARRWLAQPGRSGKPEWKDNVLHPAEPKYVALQVVIDKMNDLFGAESFTQSQIEEFINGLVQRLLAYPDLVHLTRVNTKKQFMDLNEFQTVVIEAVIDNQ